LSAVPDSVAAAVDIALPATSVAVEEGVHVIVPVPAAVVVVPLWVPSVIVILEPDSTIARAGGAEGGGPAQLQEVSAAEIDGAKRELAGVARVVDRELRVLEAGESGVHPHDDAGRRAGPAREDAVRIERVARRGEGGL
jgi:hypothetical protein